MPTRSWQVLAFFLLVGTCHTRQPSGNVPLLLEATMKQFLKAQYGQVGTNTWLTCGGCLTCLARDNKCPSCSGEDKNSHILAYLTAWIYHDAHLSTERYEGYNTLSLGLIEAYQLVWHLGLRPRMPKLADTPRSRLFNRVQ